MIKFPALLLCAALLAGCSEPHSGFYPGYAEADYVRLASPVAGTLARLHLRRGEQVPAQAPAFVLEQESERAARAESAARVERMAALVADLRKGRRPDEVAALQAQLAQAQAASQLSRANLARQQQLVASGFIAPTRIDEARAAAERDRARIGELQAQLRVARLGARSDEIRAAEQELAAAQAQLAQAEWKLDQKTVKVPAAAQVIDVLYREGEWVQAGSPVATLLPPQNIKARFFVPQAVASGLRLGQEVTLHCDGCAAPLPARISFISPSAEYTSPLIYSKENRASLVFMIEAQPSAQDAARLHPGLPLDVRLDPKQAS